jgi:hypothetical protein
VRTDDPETPRAHRPTILRVRSADGSGVLPSYAVPPTPQTRALLRFPLEKPTRPSNDAPAASELDTSIVSVMTSAATSGASTPSRPPPPPRPAPAVDSSGVDGGSGTAVPAQQQPARSTSTEWKPGVGDDCDGEPAQDNYPSPAARRGIVDGRTSSSMPATPAIHGPSPALPSAPVATAPNVSAVPLRVRPVKSSLDFGGQVAPVHCRPRSRAHARRPRGGHATTPTSLGQAR